MIELTPEQVPGIVTRKDMRVFLIGMVGRVAVAPFVAAIEWFWYPPSSPRNRFYDLYAVQWQEQVWLMVAFPGSQMPKVKRLANNLGLRIANGVPLIVGGDQLVSLVSGRTDAGALAKLGEFFPGGIINRRDNLRMFTIEAHHGSPVYKNCRRDHKAMFQAGVEIAETLNRGVRLTVRQIADYIYGSGPFPVIDEDMHPDAPDH